MAAHPLEGVGGAVPLQSNFYIQRRVDLQLSEAIARKENIILIKGARQVGKTSLLARGLHESRQGGCKVVLTDFQKLNRENLRSLNNFYETLAHSIADSLNVGTWPEDVWEESLSPNANFEQYFIRHVLDAHPKHLVWGLDEVDRIFTRTYSDEVFSLFRSWYNERTLNPASPWGKLTLIIGYATEAALFIQDINMSPFNVGTRLILGDFTLADVTELNRRYGSPIRTDGDLRRFHELVGGHPYLVRRSFHEMVSRKKSFATFRAELEEDEHIFEDHLRRIVVLLTRDFRLLARLKSWLEGESRLDSLSFKRLRQGGLVKGLDRNDARLRCELYSHYLRGQLLD